MNGSALLLSAWLLGCGGAPSDAPADGVAEEDPLAPIADVPAFALTDHTGAPYTEQQLRGHVTVVDFIFTSCKDVCPVLTTHMSEVQGRYAGNDAVRFLSISVDPGTDTPEVLAAYAQRFGADPARWRFVTGGADAIRAVVVEGFKSLLERVPGGKGADGAPAPEAVLHGERFILVDRQGRIRAYPDPKEPGKTTMYAWIDRLVAEGG